MFAVTHVSIFVKSAPSMFAFSSPSYTPAFQSLRSYQEDDEARLASSVVLVLVLLGHQRVVDLYSFTKRWIAYCVKLEALVGLLIVEPDRLVVLVHYHAWAAPSQVDIDH